MRRTFHRCNHPRAGHSFDLEHGCSECAAISVRTAAINFVRNIGNEPTDDHDTKGAALNRRLLDAAWTYGNVTRKAGAR